MLREGQLDEDEGMIFGKRFLHGSWVLYKIMTTEISDDGITSLFHLPHQRKRPRVQDEVTILNPVAMKQASNTPL